MKVSLECSSDKSTEPVHVFLKTQAQKSKPILYWVEPRPGIAESLQDLKPVPGFSGLTSEPPDWNLAMAEARIFWKDGMIHVTALAEGGCRWFECHEKPAGSGSSDAFQREEYTVLLRRDWKRFGKEKDKPQMTEVKVIEYRKKARLAAWRILSVEGTSGKKEQEPSSDISPEEVNP